MRRRALLLALAALPLARAAMAEARVVLQGGGLRMELGPERVVEASASEDGYGGWMTSVRLTEEAAAELAVLTEALVTQELQVVFDGEVIMAPRVQEPIRGGAFVVSGLTQVQARRLAVFLRG